MKQYEKYKDSGIEWLEKIPLSWKSVKMKWISKIFAGGTPNTNIDEYWKDGTIPWLNSGTVNQKRIKTPSSFITEQAVEKSSTKWVPKDSLLMALAGQGKTKGTVAILEIDATCNQSMAAIIPERQKIKTNFLYYWLDSNYKRIRGLAGSEQRDGLNLQIIGGIYCPIPSIQEQSQIAQYLDHQTNLIDQLITKKENLVQLLQEQRQAIINEAVTKGLDPNVKMKDSGIEWLGEIPEEWQVKRLKNISKIYGRIGYRGYTVNDIVNEGEGAITISPSNMKGDYMQFDNCTYLSWEKYEESPEIKINNNDILMVKTGSTYGKVGIVKKLERKATINPQIVVLKNLKINADFLFNLMRTPLFQNQVELDVIGSTIPTIAQSKILDFIILEPPTDKVNQIVKFIEKESSVLDKLISKTKLQINKLKEYRQSIISEAVTGKIDVRDWQPTTKTAV